MLRSTYPRLSGTATHVRAVYFARLPCRSLNTATQCLIYDIPPQLSSTYPYLTIHSTTPKKQKKICIRIGHSLPCDVTLQQALLQIEGG